MGRDGLVVFSLLPLITYFFSSLRSHLKSVLVSIYFFKFLDDRLLKMGVHVMTFRILSSFFGSLRAFILRRGQLGEVFRPSTSISVRGG